MTLRLRAKVLIHVWSYDFYDMALSTEEQRRHIINTLTKCKLYVAERLTERAFKINC